MLRKWPLVVAGLYFLGGIATWAQFVATDGYGLGNLGLLTYVMPISLVGFGIGKLTGAKEFALVPPGMDPHIANTIYFLPSLVLLTYVLGWRLPALYRRLMAD